MCLSMWFSLHTHTHTPTKVSMVTWFSDNPVFIRFAPCVHIKMYLNLYKIIFFNSFQNNLCSYIASLLVFLHRDIDIRDSIRHGLYSLKSLFGGEQKRSHFFVISEERTEGRRCRAAVFQSVTPCGQTKGARRTGLMVRQHFTKPESLGLGSFLKKILQLVLLSMRHFQMKFI